MSNLRKTQSEFVICIAKLIEFAYEQGYELTFSDAFRSAEECERRGFRDSCHGIRLAIDLNLFENGVYQRQAGGHTILGAHWLTLHPLARHGGDWGDHNHYSFTYGGRK